MAYIALVPKRDVFKRHHRVTANHARESTQSLARYRVAFVRHGRAPFLAFAKIFLHFENFSPLKMTKFCCPAIDAGSDHGQRRHKFGVARSEEHTSELQSHSDLVCRLLLEKKKNKKKN